MADELYVLCTHLGSRASASGPFITSSGLNPQGGNNTYKPAVGARQVVVVVSLHAGTPSTPSLSGGGVAWTLQHSFAPIADAAYPLGATAGAWLFDGEVSAPVATDLVATFPTEQQHIGLIAWELALAQPFWSYVTQGSDRDLTVTLPEGTQPPRLRRRVAQGLEIGGAQGAEQSTIPTAPRAGNWWSLQITGAPFNATVDSADNADDSPAATFFTTSFLSTDPELAHFRHTAAVPGNPTFFQSWQPAWDGAGATYLRETHMYRFAPMPEFPLPWFAIHALDEGESMEWRAVLYEIPSGPRFRHRQRDDDLRAYVGGPNQPTSRQRSLRRGGRNVYS